MITLIYIKKWNVTMSGNTYLYNVNMQIRGGRANRVHPNLTVCEL